MEEKRTYRFPGATPFSSRQKDLFFGRKGDTEALLKLIRRERVVLLHSKSGLGKSSLLNAGIIPRSDKVLELHPVALRFRAYDPSKDESPLEVARIQLRKLAEGETFLTDKVPNDDSLWLLAKNYQIKSGKSLLLLFDQFEELFTYPDHQVDEFQQQLAEVLNTSLPLRYNRKLDAIDLSEDQEDALYDDLNLHVLFAIRSDRLAEIEAMKSYFPGIMRHSYELKALTRIDAEEAIVMPASAPGDYLTPAFKFDDPVLTQLLNFLEDPVECRVEGILLQMLCEHYERRFVEGQGITLLKDIGDPAEVVRNYYEEKVKMLPEGDVEKARRLIEEGLVSKGQGMRLSLHESFIELKFGVDGELLARLVDNRLLRAEPFSRGGYTYELTHDRLVPAVVRMRDQRLEAEAERDRQAKLELEQEKARELEEKLRAEEQAKQKLENQNRRVMVLLGASLVLGLIALWAFLDGRKQKDNLQAEKERGDTLVINTQRTLDALEKTKAKMERIIDAFYFYDDRLAMAVKNLPGGRKYGFIDKDGNAQIPYIYDLATPFDENGFARAFRMDERVKADTLTLDAGSKKQRTKVSYDVQYEQVEFILDDTGKEYEVAYSTRDLLRSTRALNLIGTGIKQIPSSVGNYPDLELVFLDGSDVAPNSYSWLPSSLGRLKNLKHFSCSHGKLSRSLGWIKNLSNLEILDLSHNKLTSIPKGTIRQDSLLKLDLAENDLRSVNLDLSPRSQLDFLDLSGNKLPNVEGVLDSLVNLEILNLERNELTQFPTDLMALRSLKYLDLSDNKLSEEDIVGIFLLRRLEFLDLSSNHLMAMGMSSYLSLAQQMVKYPISNGLGNLVNLKTLGLRDCDLIQIPGWGIKELRLLQNLEWLDMAENSYTNVPEEIFELYKLKNLDLSQNQIRLDTFPSGKGFPWRLENLGLSYNAIHRLPEQIGFLKRLRTLDLAYNVALEELPESIGQLEQLEVLNLSHTGITSFPESMKNLKNLRLLQLYGTKIPFETLAELKKVMHPELRIEPSIDGPSQNSID